MDTNSLLVHRYLDGDMSAEEIREFEARLSADKDLQKELMVQRQVMQAIVNNGIKNEFRIAIKKRVLTRNLVRLAIFTGVAAAAFVVYALVTGMFSAKHEAGTGKELAPTERFVINSAADTIIETKEGVIFAIPAGAFSGNGSPVELEVKSALTPQSIIENGLSTVSNGQLLQTGGMFYINGMQDGKPVPMVKDIAVSVPAATINPAMQLFDGVEDTNGVINWVNPKPVEKNLRTMDLQSLDFYPKDYIPTLKALGKDYTNKKYTDSLYYSFSGYNERAPEGEGLEADYMDQNPTPGTTPVLNESDDWNNSSKDTVKKSIKQVVTDTSITGNQYYHSDSAHTPYYEIDPARIQALKDDQFANSFVATEEFAERVRYMHTLCTSRYLDVYLQMLDKPLYEADLYCAKNSSGEIKKKFREFAARKDGGVILAKGIQEKLTIYFLQKVNAYREAAAKTWAAYEAELRRLYKIADEKTAEHSTTEMERIAENFKEEFCINLTTAYEQIGIKRSCKDTIVPPQRPYYNFNISTPGWKNLDVYVFEATRDRENMTYTDPVSGKTAQLTYTPVNIRVENYQSFDKVLVYLLPDSLSSFQRVVPINELFTEKLNSLFRYDAIVLAYKGTQAFYYQQEDIQPGTYTFKLSAGDDTMINAVLNKYTIGKTGSMKTEIAYQLFEQQEAIRMIELRKEVAFREQVAWSIFACKGDAVRTKPVAATQ